MGRHFALVVAGILLLTVGAILLVNRLTEYQPPPRSAAERASDRAGPAAPDLPVQAQPPADYSQQGPGEPIVIPAGPMVGGAVQNESPPIQGPTAIPLPVVPEDPDDDVLFGTALAGGARFVVSGDAAVLAVGGFAGVQVVSAAQFLATLGEP